MNRMTDSKKRATVTLDPDRMILDAKALQEVTRKLRDEARDHLGDSHRFWGNEPGGDDLDRPPGSGR